MYHHTEVLQVSTGQQVRKSLIPIFSLTSVLKIEDNILTFELNVAGLKKADYHTVKPQFVKLCVKSG